MGKELEGNFKLLKMFLPLLMCLFTRFVNKMVSKKHEFLLESILATLNIANGLSKNTIKSNDVIDKELLTFKASNNTILAFKMFN